MKIVNVVDVEVCGPSSVRLTFDDGTQKRVELRQFLRGPIFEPLQEAAYFARVEVDHDAGTIVWPNGADIAPETLYELPDEDAKSERRSPSAT